jgi:hypothetical protein
MIKQNGTRIELRFQRWRFETAINPGALPQAGDECCAFGAKHRPDTLSVRQAGSLCYNYFFTISAFSIMATPPRSASLPLTVMFLPQYSAS